MKVIRVVVLLTVFYIFSSIPFSVQAKDCSHLKVLSHKWNVCKAGSDKYDNGATSTSAEPKNKEKTNSFWEKIKNFGGKNIGEPG